MFATAMNWRRLLADRQAALLKPVADLNAHGQASHRVPVNDLSEQG